MSIKPLLGSPLSRLAQDTVARQATNSLQQAVQGAVAQAQAGAADTFDLAGNMSRLWQDVSRPERSLLPGNFGELVNKVDLKKARALFARICAQRISDPAGDTLVAQTQGLRDALSEVRRLGAQLEKLPPGDPRRPQAEQALAAAEARLTSLSGYTARSAPKAGALWLDPQFLHRELPQGQVHADRFPTRAPVTRPPEPLDFLFGSGTGRDQRNFTLDQGRDATSPAFTPLLGREAYKAEVAKNRQQAGMPVEDGEPIGVHVSFQGGGGKGKRYGATMAEMYAHGVVPTSMAGSSAGAIAAALVATGADPAQLNAFVTDPRIKQFFDLDLLPDDGGVFNGNVAYDTIDQELRKLTGIHDRPVTFADLKVPLAIYAAKASDSAPEPGKEDLTQVHNRLFVFSQETTPDTPVVLAVRASMAIPGVFDPVQMVDPVTGRRVHLVDGGALDNLPMGNSHGLPQLGISLLERGSNHPQEADNRASPKPLAEGNVDSSHIVWNAINGYSFLKESAVAADDFRDRTQPKANQFMFSVPVWNLKDPGQQNTTLGFGYDEKVDPALDAQTRELTRDFLRRHLADMRTPGASGTNVTAELPNQVRFSMPVELKGRQYTVTYEGGDKVRLTGGGESKEFSLGRQRIEAMYLDHQAFGDLSAQLAHVLKDARSVRPFGLPF
jgi:NTE family protein